jgi:hypothetical protein
LLVVLLLLIVPVLLLLPVLLCCCTALRVQVVCVSVLQELEVGVAAGRGMLLSRGGLRGWPRCLQTMQRYIHR